MSNLDRFMEGLKALEKETGLTITSCCFNLCHVVEVGDPVGPIFEHSKAKLTTDSVKGLVIVDE